MFEFFSAVAAALAIAGPVVSNLGEIAEGGKRILDFAGDIWNRFRKKVPPQQQQVVLQHALAEAAAMPQAAFDKKVEQIVLEALPDQSPEDRRAATEYLKLIPARIRTTFSRPEDPSGTTVPAAWNAIRAEDIVPILPPRPPRFKEGDIPPGASNWILTERLGIGGFGEVWKARSKTMQSSFRAFKFCLDPASQENIIKNELVNIELVQNELADHPHIVKLLEANLDSDTPWLQYEYVPGGDLGQLVSTWGNDLAVRAQLAVDKLLVLADTLAHCHAGFEVDGQRKLVIHRDMKPANVLVGRNGTLKITDFGISDTQARQALDEARMATVSNMTCGTPSLVRWANTPMYASPQQKEGARPHPTDDVHALGVMLYQMILGNINRQLYHDYRDVLERKHVCPQLVEVVVRSTASDHKDRYQHAGELVEALKRLPKKLIAEPVPVDPREADRKLYAAIDARVADAQGKNDTARRLLDERKWREAVTVLESIFHPIMRDEDAYTRAVQHRDGKRFVNVLGMEFALVPKGTFWMGGQDGACGDKQVSIDQDFYIGVYPVTQEEWQKVMGSNPSHFQKGGKGADKLSGVPDADIKRFPVECVSWKDCQTFIQKLNEKMRESGWMYRLPHEAEWEYACRGGATSQADCAWSYYFKSPANTLSPQLANFSESNLGRPTKVGLYQPNALGIYDMHGNVWEWCEDLYSADGSLRVRRGGSWDSPAEYCRAAYRAYLDPALSYFPLGLRLARVPVREQKASKYERRPTGGAGASGCERRRNPSCRSGAGR